MPQKTGEQFVIKILVAFGYDKINSLFVFTRNSFFNNAFYKVVHCEVSNRSTIGFAKKRAACYAGVDSVVFAFDIGD
jgi:hypothetical protein